MKKRCQNPFLAILRLKILKKVPMAIKLAGGGKALVAQPLVEELFFCGFPKLRTNSSDGIGDNRL